MINWVPVRDNLPKKNTYMLLSRKIQNGLRECFVANYFPHNKTVNTEHAGKASVYHWDYWAEITDPFLEEKEPLIECCGECGFWRSLCWDVNGSCHRYPPAVSSTTGHIYFCSTRKGHWCGEFKSKNKK